MKDLTKEINIIKNFKGELNKKQLSEMGLNQYYINKLLNDEVLERVDRGIYKYNSKASSLELYNKVLNYLDSKNFSEARKYLKLAIEQNPNYDMAYLRLMINYLYEKNYRKTLDTLKDYLDNKEDLSLDLLDKMICKVFDKAALVPSYILDQADDKFKDYETSVFVEEVGRDNASNFYQAALALDNDNFAEFNYFIHKVYLPKDEKSKAVLKLYILNILASNINYKEKVEKKKMYEDINIDFSKLFAEFNNSYNINNFKNCLSVLNKISDGYIINDKYNPMIKCYRTIILSIIDLRNGIKIAMDNDYKVPSFCKDDKERLKLSIENKNYMVAKSLISGIIEDLKYNNQITMLKSYYTLSNLLNLLFTYNNVISNLNFNYPEIDFNKFRQDVNNNNFDEAFEMVNKHDNKGLFRVLFNKLKEETLQSDELSYIDFSKIKEEKIEVDDLIDNEYFSELSVYIMSFTSNNKKFLLLEAYILEQLYKLGYYKEAEPYYKDLEHSGKCNKILDNILTLKQKGFSEINS